MAVYLLHSSVPLVRCSGREVRHYVGYTPDGQVYRRLEDHRKGRSSAAIVREFLRQEGRLQIGNIWAGETPADEKRRKAMGHLTRQCYVCRLQALYEEYQEMLRPEEELA